MCGLKKFRKQKNNTYYAVQTHAPARETLEHTQYITIELFICSLLP